MSNLTQPSKRLKTSLPLTLKDISEDQLTLLAKENWSGEKCAPFSDSLVREIYACELQGPKGLGSSQRTTLLEWSQYLERYLWPNFVSETSSKEHLVSILILINQKLNERTNPWPYLQNDEEKFGAFFESVLEVDLWNWSPSERIHYILFMTHCFQSLENKIVRTYVLKLVSLPLWHNLSEGRLRLELKNQPSLMKKWNRLLKKEAKTNPDASHSNHEVSFLVHLIDIFLEQIEILPEAEDVLHCTFCERFLEFLTDLLSQLPTRRFVRILLVEKAIHVKCKMSPLYDASKTSLFRQLVDLYAFYLEFNIDEHSGEPFSEDESLSKHYNKLTQLQRLIFRFWDSVLHDFALMPCAELQERATLTKLVETLSKHDLICLVISQLKLLNENDAWNRRSDFVKEVFISHFQRRKKQSERIHAMPLFPTEEIFWDCHKIPDPNDSGMSCLPVPKLNLQFLSLYDYLMRNFELYRLEAAYEIQEDLGDVLSRMGATLNEEDRVIYKGWARMASPVTSIKIVEIQKPHLGYEKPAAVRAEIVFSTQLMRKDVKEEWDTLKQHDVVFLVRLDPNASQADDGASPKELYGVTHVRGCEILEIKDAEGKLMNDFAGKTLETFREPVGFVRTLLVELDTAQYHMDVSGSEGEALYNDFHFLMRRRPKENNFKSVLECIRDLMNTPPEMEWLQDAFLGYGPPAAAHYTHLHEKPILKLDMKDTFQDLEHVDQCFPEHRVVFEGESRDPPYRVRFSTLLETEAEPEKIISVESYQPNRIFDGSGKQGIRFTPVQTKAIVSGMQHGLTMIVGPPGTGKTDVAVQILQMLFHNFPNERTLLITHSNHALNDLFQKLAEKDVPARYLLRLGMGERDLETELDFSRAGRVNALLSRRLELLQEVSRLAQQLKVSEDVAYSCETAGHFWMLHVLPRWEKFRNQIPSSEISIAERFPFTSFFRQPLFKGETNEDLETAMDCFVYLKSLFQELEECRPFELLKVHNDRVNHLLVKQSKIVAMTCTHAALKRKDFLSIGFQYDNVLMEESAQALEIETFIPWTLQNSTQKLKRIILIGDHHQLPPVVRHPAFQKYSHLDQSLFARFVRLGMPFLELDAQGRSRPSIAKLFNWRYDALGDLPVVQIDPVFQKANPGFAFDYQFIDVIDPTGQGESMPTPFFYQNLAEAEFVVYVYQYMRLLGFPNSKISILTTYNGQKHLLRDVLANRCSKHPAFGNPLKVTTVDDYQGQQNDFILLSLVRTRSVGHLRDLRRLVVATSRARLGLYVFGSAGLFQNCFEMQNVFKQWNARPLQLALVKGESYLSCDRSVDASVSPTMIPGVNAMSVLVQQMTMEWEVHAVHTTEIPQSNTMESDS